MIKEELLSLWQQYDHRQLRKFGNTMAGIFLLLCGYLWYISSDLLFYSLSVSLLFLVLGWWKPGLLKYIYYIWMSFALILGSVMSRVILAIVFLVVFVPVGIVMRILNKDPLHRSIQPEDLCTLCKE